ncbi:MAG TPA: flavin reductase family protein [Phycisphaerales bacterium]|nr:flavin reductase family protein [Phycisphaerales bacterium]
MSQPEASGMSRAMAQIPCGSFVLTAAHDDASAGVLVHWVQRCSVEPPLVAVALERGHFIEPLIRDSRAFALCQIAANDPFLARKFTATAPPPAMRPGNGGEYCSPDDPFISLAVRLSRTGSPIIERSMSYLECELAHNIDLAGDHRLYVGLVLTGGMLCEAEPAIYFGENGSALK